MGGAYALGFCAEATKEDFVGCGVGGVVFEACAFKPLGEDGYACVGFHLWFGDGVAEECERFACGDAAIAKVESMSTPVVPELGGDGVAGLGGVVGGVRAGFWEVEPVAPLVAEYFYAEPPKEDGVGCVGVFGVVFEALTFEELDGVGFSIVGAGGGGFVGEGVAKDGEATIVVPEGEESMSQGVVSFWEVANIARLCSCGERGEQCDGDDQQYRKIPFHHGSPCVCLLFCIVPEVSTIYSTCSG